MESKKSEVIFLFGAGASMDAGVPDTFSFVGEFQKSMEKNPSLSSLLANLLKILEARNKKDGKKRINADIEQLLEVLRRLIDRENDKLLDFYENKALSLTCDNENLNALLHSLENFIREKVIIENENSLSYLNELLTFKRPVEIFSTNYDTCIEQMCYINHMRYTDGFDIYWNPKNLHSDAFDFLHFKLHGSVIWFENESTKECVKIPVHSFVDKQPVELRLIYGENVKPLIIYPAQKAEYVEPLTELQLMFKERLSDNHTKFLVAVGHSFRDSYLVHMLWDAARANKDLQIILISPDAQEIYETKLRYINRDDKSQSRISNRVVCLPYPFQSIIKALKNEYLNKLSQINYALESSSIDETIGKTTDWGYSLRLSIDAEDPILTEVLLSKIGKDWTELSFGTKPEILLYGFKGLLHSVNCADGFEHVWLNRVNRMFEKVFNVGNLSISSKGTLAYCSILLFGRERIEVKFFLDNWIRPLIQEKNKRLALLTPKFEKSLLPIKESLNKLDEFANYLNELSKGVQWGTYKFQKGDSEQVKSCINGFAEAKIRGYWDGNKGEPDSLILGIERERFKQFLGNDSFQLKVNSE